jgi:hypothetical protein
VWGGPKRTSGAGFCAFLTQRTVDKEKGRTSASVALGLAPHLLFHLWGRNRGSYESIVRTAITEKARKRRAIAQRIIKYDNFSHWRA